MERIIAVSRNLFKEYILGRREKKMGRTEIEGKRDKGQKCSMARLAQLIGKMWGLKKGLETPRGYFEEVDYFGDGKLTINGWMLLPDKKIDSISVFINRKYMCETGILE